MLELVFSQVGPWVVVVAVLVGAIYLLATGKVVSHNALEDREDLVKLYREALEREHEARVLADKQLGEMLELGRTANHVLTALPAAKPAPAPEGDDGNASAMA